jgi:hypothetical protein
MGYAAATEADAERGGNATLLGISLGVAAIAIAALAFVLTREPQDSLPPGLREADDSRRPATVEAPPPAIAIFAPAPTATPAVAASPSPIAIRTPPAGIMIEDIRFANERPVEDSMPVIVLTPAPTPYVPKEATGDRAMLLDPATGATPSPTPTPTPVPTATPLPGREIAPGARELFSEEFDGFRIDAILHDSVRPVVMVGGRERVVGETISGYLLESIEPEAIELTRDGVRYRVRF